MYFFTYNAAKERYKELTGQSRLHPVAHLVSAAEAGAIVCCITNPIWVVKTRLQLQRKNLLEGQLIKPKGAPPPPPPPPFKSIGPPPPPTTTPLARDLPKIVGAIRGPTVPRPLPPVAAYRGFVDCLTQIATTEGIRGLYKGLVPSLFLVSHGAIQFAVYEELKAAAYHLRDFIRPLDDHSSNSNSSPWLNLDSNTLTSIEITVCGALSKLAASVVTYPSQVVRSRLQQRMDARALRYKGVMDVVQTTVAREGVRGLYKGLVPNVLRVMPQSALTFLVYESVMHQLHRLSIANDSSSSSGGGGSAAS